MSLPFRKQGWLTPQLPQRQDSLDDQLRDLASMANRMGCYDAADWIRKQLERDTQIRKRLLNRDT